MSGFVIINKEGRNQEVVSHVIGVSKTVFHNKTMLLTTDLEYEKFRVLVFSRLHDESSHILRIGDQDFVLSIGVCVPCNSNLDSLLMEFYDKEDLSNPVEGLAIGCFIIIIYKEGRLYSFQDSAGLLQVYMDNEHSVISTSLLVVQSFKKDWVVDKQEYLEYVFHGNTFGRKTMFRGITKLDSRYSYQFIDRYAEIHRKDDHLECNSEIVLPTVTKKSYVENIEKIACLLVDNYALLEKTYGNRLALPITGGYDSRILACLSNKLHMHPDFTFVLKKDYQNDVSIARQIANHCNWEISVIENDFPNWMLDESLGVLERQFFMYDGHGIGGVFQYFSGMDIYERLPEGHLFLDGSGGEIFRNMYRIQDRSYDVSEYVVNFIIRKDIGKYLEKKELAEYIGNLTEKICSEFRLTTRISTLQTRILYPGLIHKYWIGLSISNAMQYGASYCPFTESNIVKAALALPIKWRNGGEFEARLIKYIDAELAKIPSNYGHDFYNDRNWMDRAEEELKIMLAYSGISKFLRPLFDRIRKYRFKENPYYGRAEYASTIGKILAIRNDIHKSYRLDYLNLDNLTDNSMTSRAVSVELSLCQKLIR